MPRKQRFKPSRKPKPVEPTSEPTANQPQKRDEPASERPRIDPADIESGGGVRTSAVIDDSP